jgi:hypothetical protein
MLVRLTTTGLVNSALAVRTAVAGGPRGNVVITVVDD